jgi:RNA polymerase sigma factor for flagellar operon FliA
MLQHECASYGDASALAGYAWTQAGAAYGTVQVTPQQEQDVLQAYLPMVKRVVRQLASQAMDVMDQSDMTQVGLMGLLEALRRYGPVDEAFAGYARQRVRGAILDELRRQDWRPRTVRQSAHKARDAVRALRRQLGAEPTPLQIQQALGMDDEAYLAYEQAESAEAMASLDELVGQGMDMASSAADPQHAVLQRHLLEQVLAQLNEREQRVIQLYYEYDLNLKEIAAVLELSEARVCQINKEALRKMRAALEVA